MDKVLSCDSDDSELIEPTLVISATQELLQSPPLDPTNLDTILGRLQHSGERELNLFSLLMRSRRSCETKLLIPTTLVKFGALPAVLLFTNDKGVVEKSFESK